MGLGLRSTRGGWGERQNRILAKTNVCIRTAAAIARMAHVALAEGLEAGFGSRKGGERVV